MDKTEFRVPGDYAKIFATIVLPQTGFDRKKLKILILYFLKDRTVNNISIYCPFNHQFSQ